MAGALNAFNSQRKSFLFFRVLVVAQLAERSLQLPEDRGSNPDIGEFLHRTFI